MKDDSIKKLIDTLGKEVAAMDESEEKELSKMRLQEVAARYEGDDRVVSSLEIAEELKNHPRPKGILSGIGGLDYILDGFTPKQLIVLSGITKHGKTSFAMELSIRMTEYNPLWLPFEEPAEELIQKFLDRNIEPPHFFTPKTVTERTLAWCEQKIVESMAKFGSKIIFIDHLGFITPKVGENGNNAEEIAHVMRSLKDLCKKWGVIIVVLSHLNKVQLDKNPNLEDLRGSAAIGQEADTVIFIWRETKRKRDGEIEILNNVNISVQANRRTGKTGNVKLTFEKGRYIELDWKHQDEQVEEEDW